MFQEKYYYQVDTYYPSSKTYSHCDSKSELEKSNYNINIHKRKKNKYGSDYRNLNLWRIEDTLSMKQET